MDAKNAIKAVRWVLADIPISDLWKCLQEHPDFLTGGIWVKDELDQFLIDEGVPLDEKQYDELKERLDGAMPFFDQDMKDMWKDALYEMGILK